jgi:hypothetical protein
MAVVNTKSAYVTALDAAAPQDKVLVTLAGGRVREVAGTVEVAAADDDTSVFRLVRVPSNAKIVGIYLYNDALTSGTSYDLGLYQTAANGGAVVDVDAYASALDLSSARVAPLECSFEARNIDKIQNLVWEDAGLSADPSRLYDIALTANTVGSAAGTISLRVLYVID